MHCVGCFLQVLVPVYTIVRVDSVPWGTQEDLHSKIAALLLMNKYGGKTNHLLNMTSQAIELEALL